MNSTATVHYLWEVVDNNKKYTVLGIGSIGVVPKKLIPGLFLLYGKRF